MNWHLPTSTSSLYIHLLLIIDLLVLLDVIPTIDSPKIYAVIYLLRHLRTALAILRLIRLAMTWLLSFSQHQQVPCEELTQQKENQKKDEDNSTNNALQLKPESENTD